MTRLGTEEHRSSLSDKYCEDSRWGEGEVRISMNPPVVDPAVTGAGLAESESGVAREVKCDR